MAYNMSTDYMAIMQNPNSTPAQKAAAQVSRNEKLAAMNTSGNNPNNYTPTNNNYIASTAPTTRTNNNRVSASPAPTMPTGYTGSTKTTGGVFGAAQNIINQMNANSIKWYTDPANKDKYAAENQALSQRLSALQESDGAGGITTYSAAYDAASGSWSVSPSYERAAVQAPVSKAVPNTQPTLSGLELGDKYDINYDMAYIRRLLDEATKSEYALRGQQQTQLENKFYGTMLDTQGTTLDTLRRSQASAVATGASRGMAAANELSAILNLQQLSSDAATGLAQERNNLGLEEAAAYTKNASTALDSSNNIKQAIANLAATKYGYDTQGSAAYLSYLAALADVEAQRYSSDKTLEGVKYNADANVAAAGKSYGTSGKTYTAGTAGGTQSGTTPGSTPGSSSPTANKPVGETYTPDGTDLKVTRNADGTSTITNITKDGKKYEDLVVTEEERVRIENNGWDVAAIDEGYGGTTIESAYNPIDESKIITIAQAKAFLDKFGRLPAGWQYGQGAQGIYKFSDVQTQTTPQVKNNIVIEAVTGKKVSIGAGNYATTWTYNATTGMWSNSSGTSLSAAKFKEFVNKQNSSQIKVLN